MKQMARTLTYAVLLAGLFAAPVRAEEVKAGDLVITQAWSRATPGWCENRWRIPDHPEQRVHTGSAARRLRGGCGQDRGPRNGYEQWRDDNASAGEWFGNRTGKTVMLAPGGYHLMLFDLNSPLKQGEKVPLTLEFEKTGKVKVSFDVQGVGAQGPTAAPKSGSKMDMKGMAPGTKM